MTKLAKRAATTEAAAPPFFRQPQHAEYAPGSLLTVEHLTVADVAEILASTTRLEADGRGGRARACCWGGPSRCCSTSRARGRGPSFELAAKSLGATTTLVSDKSSSIEKGESLKDTGLTLRALGAEAIVLRHLASGAPMLLARVTGLPVLNAGDGMHQHPSQALLDLRTILMRLGLDAGSGPCEDAGRRDRGDYGRHSSQPRGAVECDAAAAAGRARGAVRAGGIAA